MQAQMEKKMGAACRQGATWHRGAAQPWKYSSKWRNAYLRYHSWDGEHYTYPPGLPTSSSSPAVPTKQRPLCAGPQAPRHSFPQALQRTSGADKSPGSGRGCCTALRPPPPAAAHAALWVGPAHAAADPRRSTPAGPRCPARQTCAGSPTAAAEGEEAGTDVERGGRDKGGN